MNVPFAKLSEQARERFALDLLNPEDPLFHIVGKRGLDEVLGFDYNFDNKTILEIRKDIWRSYIS